jgi:RHS repeat-associated protein
MERDEESGLEYHSARYYLPWLGRWLSADPIGIADGINVYSYVSNNPVVFIDPTGEDGNTPDPKDVATFEVREAAFEAGKKLETGAVTATRKGKPLPPPKGKALEKLAGNSRRAKELRLKYGTKQGSEAGKTLVENVKTRSNAAAKGEPGGHFGKASQKLVPEVAFNKGKIISAGKSPGGEPAGARTADLTITKEPTPPSKWQSLEGQKGTAPLDTAYDMKLGNGKVPNKPGFKKASGGLPVEEITPGTKGLIAGKAFTTLNGVVNGVSLGLMYRDFKISQQVAGYGVAVLEDSLGEYIVKVDHGIIFNDYYKTYISGYLEGHTIELSWSEYRDEKKKRDEKYGYFDWKGDFIEGRVPPVYVEPPGTFHNSI